MKDIILRNIKDKLYIIILILAICSILLINYTYVSLVIGIIAFILCLIFSRKHIKILIITILVCISSITVNYLNIKTELDKNKDIFSDTNILLGSWIYNEYDGTYVFNDDNTYIQYSNKNIEDNYCKGKYKYSYGGKANDGVIIKQDENYYYYNLELKKDYCIITGKESYDKYEKQMVVAINKFNNDDVLFINMENENIFNVKKIQDN